MPNERDSRPLRAVPATTIEMLHERVCSVEADVGEMKPQLARVETSVNLLAKLAEEERAEKRAERGVSLQRRAQTERVEGEVKLERVRGRYKVMLGILGLLGAGGGLGALLSKLTGCS